MSDYPEVAVLLVCWVLAALLLVNGYEPFAAALFVGPTLGVLLGWAS